ncbi:DUF1294 domain-containing protein [Flavobacterium piscis]|uniref:Uncharacterized membrane protein YsdA (DUF1294 family) n=1 Tax=Flavobacterium piscis TaxID=1114874 RepID=A0ABU1Y3M8_9FLAO|nr:DUF1294 domain-containing protein [Flavobacterium piscis]MDR7208668.1 uncharacterized membrane protein YsdA (DUF1294 family) [Flavobacterium piscis]
MEVLLLYFFIINSIAFILGGYDKYLAVKRKHRIPENILFTISFFGGSIGLLLAILFFKHKTSKSSFIIKFTFLFLFQIVLVYLKLTDKI